MALTSLFAPPSPSEGRARPYLVTLGVRPGVSPNGRPPVRIFLGTQDEQDRAERVFFYSIERVRDPARVYEIHVMKGLAGYVRKGWRTGFTNYRFAIPDYAGRAGKAIYNDVDQIYGADPALLFDLDPGGHGYLAVSASDTSVMLMDCARMAEAWTESAARTEDKSRLLARAKPLWGPLDPGWNARDMEYVEGRSMLLHYTAMHTQPWHPFPAAYAYRDHPLGEIWHRLERAADAEGYEIFTRANPSPMFAASATPTPLPDDLDRVPAEDVPWVLGELFRRADKRLHIAVRCALGIQVPKSVWHDQPASFDRLRMRGNLGGTKEHLVLSLSKDAGLRSETPSTPLTLRDPAWWRRQVARAAARHPGTAWRLDAIDSNRRGQPVTIAYESTLAPLAQAAPRVWVLAGPRAGDRSQLIALADALGWLYEVKDLAYNKRHHLPNWLLGASLATLDRTRSSPLAPPWPDLAIDGGKRSVPVVRWLRAQAPALRWVHVGRSWAPLTEFDLVVAAPQYRLPPRPNVLQLAATLHRITPQRLAEAGALWSDRLKHLPRPWHALLVGGHSPPYRLDVAAARRLAGNANARARASGGSLLITTSARTAADAAAALLAGIAVPAHAHRWQAGAADNPYLAFLALADDILVTGDSASMLAEACAAGKPVTLFDVPRAPSPAHRLLEAVERLLTGQGGRNYRGLPRQQGPLARLFDRLVERGLFMPLRDLREVHRRLIDRGLLRRDGDIAPQGQTPPLDDMSQAVDRIRSLISGDRRVL